MGNRGWLGAALLIATACGRFGEPKELTGHRVRWAAEARALDERLDVLEERLLTDQARVRFWHEMRDRHEQVAQVACTNLAQHAEEIARYAGQQSEKTAALARKSRVAAHFTRTASASTAR